MSPPDPSAALERFVAAQAPVYEAALAEIARGKKATHWMWFVFPQLAGLGHSAMAQRFAIASLQEARAYLAHPVLGARLAACTEAAIKAKRSAAKLFGHPDDLKFRSSMTLFEQAAPDNALFGQALDALCDGERDEKTITLLAELESRA